MSVENGIGPADVGVEVAGERVATVGGQDVPIVCGQGCDIELGVGWDFVPGGSAVDLDCSVLLFTGGGTLLDAAYYNQPICMGGAVQHSGDEKTGTKVGFDETVGLDLDALTRSRVQIVIFVVNAHHGGTLGDVNNARGEIQEKSTGEKLAEFRVACKKGDYEGVILGILHHVGVPDGEPWMLRNLGRFVRGKNFQESMNDIKQCLNAAGLLDPAQCMVMAMDRQFDMTKGQFLEIPADLFRDGADLFIGLGWESGNPQGKLDLDASIILLDSYGRKVDVVNYNNMSFLAGAIKHSGDNQTGQGKGDDERIDVDLDRLPASVHTLFIVVNVYTSWGSFANVKDAYVRLCAAKNRHEFCRFALHSQIAAPCLVFAKIFRSPMPGAWLFDTVGVGCMGRTADQNEVLQGCLASQQGINFGPQVVAVAQTFGVLPQISIPVAAVAASARSQTAPAPEQNKPCCCSLM